MIENNGPLGAAVSLGAPGFQVPSFASLPANHTYIVKLSLMLLEEATLIGITQVNDVFILNAHFKLTVFFINYKW